VHLFRNYIYEIGFEVLTAVSTKMAVFWVVAPCSLVEVYQRFRGSCCLHHHGDDGGSKDQGSDAAALANFPLFQEFLKGV
jgi:hypothetical protein